MATTAEERRPVGLYLESSPDERYGVLPGEDRPVRDLMNRDLVTIPSSASVREAATVMRDRATPYVIVTDRDRLEGIIDEHDLVVRGATQTAPLDTLSVSALLPPNPDPACREDALLADAARLMAAHGRHTIAVVNQRGHVVGVISLLDVAGAVMPNAAAAWLARVRHPAPRS